MKGNEEIGKNKNIQSKTVGIVYKSLCVLVSVCVCVCVCGGVIVVYYSVWTYKWCLVYVKIHMQCDKLEVVFRIGERSYVANFATVRLRKKFFICFFMYLCAY